MKRLSMEDWKNIFRNLKDMDEEDYYDGVEDWVGVIWLDQPDEWALAYGEELFEDGFKTEKEAQDRLNYLENELLSVQVVGYYIDRDVEEGDEIEAKDVFVALFVKGEGYSCYCPVGQHSNLDYGYLEECMKISKRDYLKISGHLYTPLEYLEGKI